jgi:predicted transcriptional regulator
MKKATSFRLSDEALALLKQLADADGLSQAAMLELLIRRAARRSSAHLAQQLTGQRQQADQLDHVH